MKRIFLPVVLALSFFSACSTSPTKTTTNENEWSEKGLRFPASVRTTSSSLEERYCSALSTFNMSISLANHAIPRAACQDLIRLNSPVCTYFEFCKGADTKSLGQNRTRVNMMVSSLNEKIAGGAGSIRTIDNLKFKARMQASDNAVGFGDLFQLISNGEN